MRDGHWGVSFRKPSSAAAEQRDCDPGPIGQARPQPEMAIEKAFAIAATPEVIWDALWSELTEDGTSYELQRTTWPSRLQIEVDLSGVQCLLTYTLTPMPEADFTEVSPASNPSASDTASTTSSPSATSNATTKCSSSPASPTSKPTSKAPPRPRKADPDGRTATSTLGALCRIAAGFIPQLACPPLPGPVARR